MHALSVSKGPVYPDGGRVCAALAPPSCRVYFDCWQIYGGSRLKNPRRRFAMLLWTITLLIASPATATPQSKSRTPVPQASQETLRPISVPRWVAPEPGPDSSADADGCGGSASDYLAWEIDLNDSGVLAVIVQGKTTCLCGAVGNCSFSIFQSVPPHKVLLDTGLVQEFHFKRARTKGYRDLVTSAHGSAFDSELRIFQFDGKRYRLKECYDKSYSYLDKQGNLHTRDHAKVTPEPCPQF